MHDGDDVHKDGDGEHDEEVDDCYRMTVVVVLADTKEAALEDGGIV